MSTKTKALIAAVVAAATLGGLTPSVSARSPVEELVQRVVERLPPG